MRKLLFSLISTLLFLALAEGALALLGSPGGAVYNLRPQSRWGMMPGMRGAPLKEVQSGRAFYVTTNEDGLRTAYRREGAPGVFTVVILGDSKIFGWGVENEQSEPAFLESALRELRPGTFTRVINAGMPGYSTVQSAILFQEIAVNYNPGLVVLEVSGHNVRQANKTDRQSYDVSGASEATWWLSNHSRLYRELRRFVLKRFPPEALADHPKLEMGAPTDGREDDVRVPVSDFKEVLESMVALGEERGFQVAVVFPPEYAVAPTRYEELLREMQEDGKLSLVDYGTAFRNAGGASMVLADDPGHFTPQGNYMAGYALASALINAGLIP